MFHAYFFIKSPKYAFVGSKSVKYAFIYNKGKNMQMYNYPKPSYGPCNT